LSKYFPATIFEKVTVSQLLHHTSGIADYEMAFEEDTVTHQIIENKDVLEWYMQNPPALFEAGTAWEYSNGGYNLLATLVEKVSGQNFERYAEEHVFALAEMGHSHYFNLAKPIDIPERANCYQQDSTGAWTQVDGNFLNGCVGEGAVYTSLMDFLSYDNHLRKRDILSPASHDLIFGSRTDLLNETPSWLDFAEGRTFSYGMGWFVSDDIAYHTGGWHGTATMVMHELDRSLTIAIFRNSSDYFDGMMNKTYALTDAYLKKTE
jgi:CubicO group peptidase (beta-lactamase class C family)